jgi:nitrate/TMAO reductase-like tetraheme cytochrome c subunit
MTNRIRPWLIKLADWMARPGLVTKVLIGFVVFGYFLVGSVEYTSRPNFCTTCHYMQPFYDSWQESSHSEVSCTTCHFPPGIAGTIRGKLSGLEQVVSYLGRSYTRRKPWAEIDDASCLLSGCHSTRTLEGEVKFKNVTFDHTSHLGEMRRGKELRCTSCHSQVVQGEHILVTESTCFLCHMKESDEVEFTSNEKLGNCTTCHNWEETTVEEMQEFRFDHTQVTELELECSKCHAQTVVGDGFVPEDNCNNCHFEADRLDKYDETELIHRTHISENKIECNQCHVRIQHKIDRLTSESELQCTTCHTGTHDEQLFLFTGHAREDQKTTTELRGDPNPMLAAGLDCSSCHLYHEELIGSAEVKRATPQSCESCHGEGYDRLLELWKKGSDAKLESLTREVTRVEKSVLATRSDSLALAISKVEDAKVAMHLVQVGKAVHNMQFSDQLIGRSYQSLNQALEIVGADLRLSGWDSTSVVPSECANCHTSGEAISTTFEDLNFSHNNHVVDREIACQTCHSNAKTHGELVVTKQQCNTCHHDEERVPDLENCETCHETQSAFYSGSYLDLDQPDMMFEEDVECSDCHWGGDEIERPEPAVCVDCHDDEYEEMPAEWHTEVTTLAAGLKSELDRVPAGERDSETYRQARQLLNDLKKGAANGTHNYELTVELLTDFRESLRQE